MTLTEAHENFVRSLAVTRSPRTVEAYSRAVRRLREFFAARGVRLVRELERKALHAWIEALAAQGASKHVVAQSVFAVRAFARWAYREELLEERGLGDDLEVPRLGRSLPRVLSVDEVLRMLDAAPSTRAWRGVRLDLRDRAILFLLYGCGLRVSELLALKATDLNLRDRLVLVANGKGGRSRSVPAAAACMEHVQRWLAVRPRCSAPELFVSYRGRPLDRGKVARLVREHAARLGLPGVHTHSLRHCAATHLLRGRADLRVVQEFLGHARLSTTEIYTHVALVDVRVDYEKAHPLARRGPGLAKSSARPGLAKARVRGRA